MKYLTVHLRTQSSTFRHPDFQNYHKSFALPPPTTMMGIAGAALGFSPLETQNFFFDNSCRLGVYGKTEGLSKDLWKYSKQAWKYSPDAHFSDKSNKLTSIIQREILFDNEFVLVYQFDDEKRVNQLKSAFENPVFALTLGNSDSLAKVLEVTISEELENGDTFSNCLFDGDFVEKVYERSSENSLFSIYVSSDPIAYDLPVAFQYESLYGRRQISRRKKYSFIGMEVKLNFKVESVPFRIGEEQILIPLISI